MFDNSILDDEEWLQDSINDGHINYQKFLIFENVEKIGKGAMGEVYKATSNYYGTTDVALKKFTHAKLTINEIVNEVNFS